ncbi:MAG: hypothetical protein J6B95_01425 [Oscillospiraceae bacterium]|nr:hypothetical protein [Oscillospiraceae bacterium]
MKTALKILTALAALVGVAYVIATYGDKIVEWCKNLLNCCNADEEDFADTECPADEAVAEEAVAEEEVAEEAPAEEPAAEEAVEEPVVEEVVEEVAAEETAPVADEEDFAG